MTVKELMDQLKMMPGEMLVVQSSDPEGNSFSESGEISFGAYADGQFGLAKLSAGDRRKGFTQEDLVNGPAVVCLWPKH